MKPSPAVSVVMPARNVGRFVDEAVESILGQRYRDFEFVILDDGSTDDTADRLRHCEKRDPRVRLFRTPIRLGPAGSSNFVVEKARAPLIARMDADDIAHPERLEWQVDILSQVPDAVLVGSLGESVDVAGRVVRGADHSRLLRPSALAPFGHSSIMFRRDAFDQAGGYRSAADKWEDIDLYLRLSDLGPMLVLRKTLMRFRQSSASTRIADGSHMLELAMERLHRCLAAYEAGRDYGALMRAKPDGLSSKSFVAAASVALWADHRIGFAGRLRERVRSPSLAARTWAAWADFSPASLRVALRALLSARNVAAAVRLGPRHLVAWQPHTARSRSA